MQSTRPNAFLQSIRHITPDQMQSAFGTFLYSDEISFSENLQFNPDEQKEFDTLMIRMDRYECSGESRWLWVSGCNSFLSIAIDEAKQWISFRPRLARLLGAMSPSVRKNEVNPGRFVGLLSSSELIKLFSIDRIVAAVLALSDTPHASESPRRKFLDDILEAILEEAYKTNDFTRFNQFREVLNDEQYTNDRIALNFSAIIIQKAAQKLSFAEFSTFYPALKQNYDKDCSLRTRGSSPAPYETFFYFNLKRFSHVENILLILDLRSFIYKCLWNDGLNFLRGEFITDPNNYNVKEFLPVMKAVKMASAISPRIDMKSFLLESFNLILDCKVTPNKTSYDDISEFLTFANRELYLHDKKEENLLTLHPLLLKQCEMVSKNPAVIATLIPKEKNKENITTKLFLQEVIKMVSSENCIAVYKQHFENSPQSLMSYFSVLFTPLLDHVLENITCEGYREKLCLLLQHACGKFLLSVLLTSQYCLKIIAGLNDFLFFKNLVESLNPIEQSRVLKNILFHLYNARDFEKFALIRKEFDCSYEYMIDVCSSHPNSLQAYIDFIEIFKQKDSGLDSAFIFRFINHGMYRMLLNIKENIDSHLFHRFLKVANENLCAYEKREEKDSPYCNRHIKSALEDFINEKPNLLGKLIGENGAPNTEIPEILRDVFFAKNKNFLKYYNRVTAEHCPVFFNMLLNHSAELRNLTQVEQEKFDQIILNSVPSFFTHMLKSANLDTVIDILFTKLSRSQVKKFVCEDNRLFELSNFFGINNFLPRLKNEVSPQIFEIALKRISNAICEPQDEKLIIKLMDRLNDLQLQTVDQFFLCNIRQIAQLPPEKFAKLFERMPTENVFREKLVNTLFEKDLAVIRNINATCLMQICTPDQLVKHCTMREELLLTCIHIFNRKGEYLDALINKALPAISKREKNPPSAEFINQAKQLFCGNGFESKCEPDFRENKCLIKLKEYIGSPKNINLKHITDAVQAIYLLEIQPDNWKDKLNALRLSMEANNSFWNSSNYNKEVATYLKLYLQAQPQSQARNDNHNMMMQTMKGTQ